jgi:Type IV secretion-system coupling protein DNA-binding domain
VGEKDNPVYIPQEVRVGHTFVVGTTRVGKTRLASIFINQDIRNGDAVIVVDPKGDLELVRDMYSACKTCGRLNDFRIVHLGFPELSAHYNPLKNYDQVSVEVYDKLVAVLKLLHFAGCFISDDDYYSNLKCTQTQANRLLSNMIITPIHSGKTIRETRVC